MGPEPAKLIQQPPATASPPPPLPVDGSLSAWKLPPARVGIALFLLSTATVLFTLAIFRLLSFFIMPSLFFDLLFVGFPLGALIGVRFFEPSPRALRSSLWILLAVMALSVAAALLCKHFDYLRAHLFEVELGRLLIQMGTFTALFLPFFCAYGLSEYVGYQVGRQSLEGRMPVVYSLYLFGAALAYVFQRLTLSTLGISRLLCLPLLLVAAAGWLVEPRAKARRSWAAICVALAAALFAPEAAERTFLALYKGEGMQSTWQYGRDGYEGAFQRWGRYSLTEILYSKEKNEFAGFYNDLMQWEYAPRYGFGSRSLGMLPIHLVPSGGSIAIIGAGGGRQVKYALEPRFGIRRILALEVEPAVFEAVRGPLVEPFGRVYEHPIVEPMLHEARSYMEASTERFDLIYMPSVGGYPQMMLEPGNMIRTLDAYRTLRSRLSDRGVLAIWYPRGLDPKGILTEQYVRTLESETIGLAVQACVSDEDFLILASVDGRRIDLADAGKFLVAEDAGLELPPNPQALPRPLFIGSDPDFLPITDSQPFLAGNVRHIFSIEQVSILFGIVAGALVLAGFALFWSLRRSGDPRIPGRSYLAVAGMSLLVGANFLVFQRCVILALFKKLFYFQDALLLGAIAFLVLSGLGSTLIRPRWRPACQMAGVVFVTALVFLQGQLGEVGTLLVVAPAAFVTGSFFPALFEAAAANPLGVFAMDAVGAALGSVTAFFVPIAFGFHVFFPVAAALFVATAFAAHRFFREPSALESDEPAAAVGDAASAAI